MGENSPTEENPLSNVVSDEIDVSNAKQDSKDGPSGEPPQLVAKPSSSTKKPKSGYRKKSNLPFPEFLPYDDPVDLAELLVDISSTIRKFVILDQEQADTAALWVTQTYLVNLFDTSPLAIINAPERACAKTLFQTVLAYLSFRPLSSSNATASALFRSVELWQPTLFFDEADTFFRDNHDLQGMVNAGYKRGGFVLRSEATGDTFEPRVFSVYGAKSIAGIALEKHLPDSTMSRGIVFNMRRKLPDETVIRLRYAEDGLFDTLSAKLTRAALDYAKQIQQARPTLPEDLSDRGQDNWEPLLAIASCASDEWLAKATDAALKLSRASNESVSTGNELLADIQYVFEKQAGSDQYADKISSSNLIIELKAIEDSPWATYNHGHPISPRQLAKQLALYGIKPKTVRVGKYDTPKGYDLEQFSDAFARYLTSPEPDKGTDDDSADTDDATASTESEADF